MDHDYFWKYIQQDFGEVQIHLQNILKVQNLCNQSITYLTREAILMIQKDMRAMADHFIATCRQPTGMKTPTLRDIYGSRWENNPKEFTFMEGEILCLLGLAACVQQRGIESFLKFAKNQSHSITHHNGHTATAKLPVLKLQKPRAIIADDSGTENYAVKLINKIKSFYMVLQIADPEFDEFVKVLDNLEVQSMSMSENEVRATIACPVCTAEGNDRKITFKMDVNGRWHVWSFTRHCDKFHYAIPRGVKRKQCLETEDIDDVMMDENVSDSLNLGIDGQGEDGGSANECSS